MLNSLQIIPKMYVYKIYTKDFLWQYLYATHLRVQNKPKHTLSGMSETIHTCDWCKIMQQHCIRHMQMMTEWHGLVCTSQPCTNTPPLISIGCVSIDLSLTHLCKSDLPEAPLHSITKAASMLISSKHNEITPNNRKLDELNCNCVLVNIRYKSIFTTTTCVSCIFHLIPSLPSAWQWCFVWASLLCMFYQNNISHFTSSI